MKWTSAVDIVTWLREFENTRLENIHLPSLFFKPYHFVTLGLALKKAGCKSLQLSDENESYASRMGLREAIGISAPRKVAKKSTQGRFLPIREFGKTHDFTDSAINHHIDNIVRELTCVIKRNTTTEYQESLSDCLLEIVNNFYDHAESAHDFPCLVSAQSWPKGNLIQIAIADTGVGIRHTLRENPQLTSKLSQYNACELASEYGITSKPNHNHSGYGLTLAKDLMHQAHGAYLLLSGNELFSAIQEKSQAVTLDFSWPGTLLMLEWSIDSQLDTKIVYDSWPMPEGFNQDDFF